MQTHTRMASRVAIALFLLVLIAATPFRMRYAEVIQSATGDSVLYKIDGDTFRVSTPLYYKLPSNYWTSVKTLQVINDTAEAIRTYTPNVAIYRKLNDHDSIGAIIGALDSLNLKMNIGDSMFYVTPTVLVNSTYSLRQDLFPYAGANRDMVTPYGIRSRNIVSDTGDFGLIIIPPGGGVKDADGLGWPFPATSGRLALESQVTGKINFSDTVVVIPTKWFLRHILADSTAAIRGDMLTSESDPVWLSDSANYWTKAMAATRFSPIHFLVTDNTIRPAAATKIQSDTATFGELIIGGEVTNTIDKWTFPSGKTGTVSLTSDIPSIDAVLKSDTATLIPTKWFVSHTYQTKLTNPLTRADTGTFVVTPYDLSQAISGSSYWMVFGNTIYPAVATKIQSDSADFGVMFIGYELQSGTGKKWTFPDSTGRVALLSNIPNVYSWALASTKPSYTFSEIGTTPTTLAGYGITNAIHRDSLKSVNGNDLRGTGDVTITASVPNSVITVASNNATVFPSAHFTYATIAALIPSGLKSITLIVTYGGSVSLIEPMLSSNMYLSYTLVSPGIEVSSGSRVILDVDMDSSNNLHITYRDDTSTGL